MLATSSTSSSRDVKRKAAGQGDSETPPGKKSNKPQAFEAKIGEECGLVSFAACHRQSRSELRPTDQNCCIICQDTKPDRTNRRVQEKLTQCVTYEAEYNLLDAAKIRGHGRVVLELEGADAIAKEIKYHRTCYTAYANKKSLQNLIKQAACLDVGSAMLAGGMSWSNQELWAAMQLTKCFTESITTVRCAATRLSWRVCFE